MLSKMCCRSAPFVVLRVAAFSQTWLARVAARAASARRCLAEHLCVFLVMCYLIGLAVSGASVLCFTWATMLRQCCREGASCGWRRSRKGVPTGSARTPRGTLRHVRAPAVWRNFRAHTCVWYQVFAQRCSPTSWANTRNGSPRNPGKFFG